LKKSVFKKYNLNEPKTWDEFLELNKKLKDNKITPIGIGTKNNWPAASWFSYLDLRINGLDFHRKLLTGENSFKDEKVKKVLTTWKELIDKGYFIKKSEKYDWKGILPYMYRDKVGMYLIGNFALSRINIPLSKFGFFRFPIIDEKMPIYEEAPTDVLFINKKSTKKESSKKFLEFMARPKSQYMLNEVLGFISPNNNAQDSNNEFVKVGAEILGQAEGVSQFFDRDTSQGMANEGFEIFGEFIRNPNIDKTMEALEKSRLKNLVK